MGETIDIAMDTTVLEITVGGVQGWLSHILGDSRKLSFLHHPDSFGRKQQAF